MGKGPIKRWLLLVAVLALIAAACSDDSSDTTAAPATTAAVAAPTTTAAAAAAVDCMETTDNSRATDGSIDDIEAAGRGAAGPPCELPEVLVGYLQWVYADEAGKRIEDAAHEAVDFLGWEYETCDAGGDNAKMPVCGNQLLDKGIDVLLTDGIPEEFITDVLERATAAGVPVLSAGGEVDPRNIYIASYASDDTDMGVQLAEYLKVQLPNGGKVIAQTFPAAWSDKRINGMNATLKDSNIEVVDEWGADPLNFVDGTAQEVSTKLQQYGDIDAVWINFSLASIGAAQAIGVLPEDEQPLLVTFYANPTSVADILEGRLDAAVDEKLEWQSWAQVDALAQLLTRGQVPSQDRAPNYNGVNFSARQVITIDNVPTDGSEIPAPVEYEAFCRAKWCAEFTNLPSC